jgi:biotin carboxyl carrier protein
LVDEQLQLTDLSGIMERLSSLAEEAADCGDASPTKAPVEQLIDWNYERPEGTPESLRLLLQAIDRRFHASVFLGHLSRAGHVKHIYCSDHAWCSLKRKPLWLRNVLVEAAHCRRTIGSSQAFGTLTSVMVQANRELGSGAVLGVGLKLDAGQPNFGCVLALRETLSFEQAEQLAISAEHLASELVPWLRCWHHNYVARHWVTRITRLSSLLQANPKRVALAVLCVALLLCVPLPYWPKRACVIEPTVRQYISSPMDGRVLESLVKPGETVAKGQVLARLDDEELRWDLVSAQAEYEATAKKRDMGLASKSSGNMRVAQLELEQIHLRIEAIKANMERLTVRSPIDGVVLQGDWFRSQGAPVSRGDTLFEVAPLDRMTVETHLSTEDLPQIHVGDAAALRVDSHQGLVWHGQLERIDPRAKIIDEQVVFVAELEISGGVEELKPGMKGTVTLSSGMRSIGWLLFHRPYQWLLKKLLW